MPIHLQSIANQLNNTLCDAPVSDELRAPPSLLAALRNDYFFQVLLIALIVLTAVAPEKITSYPHWSTGRPSQY